MNYKEVIKAYMEKNKISYSMLGRMMGISRQRVWSMFNNKKTGLSMNTVEKICEVLGLEIEISSKDAV